MDQTDRVLNKAEDVDQILLLFDGKLETLFNLAGRTKWTFFAPIYQYLFRSVWTQLFRRGNMNVVKQERNLQLLDQFPAMIKTNLSKLRRLINQLTSFKAEMDPSLRYSSSFSIEEQKHRLKQSLDGLTELKQSLNKKQKEQERDLSWKEEIFTMSVRFTLLN